MNNKFNEKVEKYFKDDLLLKEAKDVLQAAENFNKLELYSNLFEEAKEAEEVYFGIDCLKSILLNEGLIEKKQSDKFGNVTVIDFGEC